jgi:hypothetical protein
MSTKWVLNGYTLRFNFIQNNIQSGISLDITFFRVMSIWVFCFFWVEVDGFFVCEFMRDLIFSDKKTPAWSFSRRAINRNYIILHYSTTGFSAGPAIS